MEEDDEGESVPGLNEDMFQDTPTDLVEHVEPLVPPAEKTEGSSGPPVDHNGAPPSTADPPQVAPEPQQPPAALEQRIEPEDVEMAPEEEEEEEEEAPPLPESPKFVPDQFFTEEMWKDWEDRHHCLPMT